MKILTYDKLKDRNDIFLLWFKSFGWPGTPRWLESFRKLDTRIGKGPVGMCGIMDGKVAGIVGMMTIPTRTKEGNTVNIGGIFGIATHPDYNRKGIGKKLLKAAEEYFIEKQLKFTFLTTSKSLVAYKWYLLSGYRNVKAVENYSHMYKIFKKQNSRPSKKTLKKNQVDFDKIQKIYDDINSNRCGFTLRTAKLLKANAQNEVFSNDLSVMTKEGYALMSSTCGSVVIKEMIARNQKTYFQLIKMAEKRARYGVMAIHPFDHKAQSALDKAGYVCDEGAYITLMYKPLGDHLFSDYYDSSFTISKIDWF